MGDPISSDIKYAYLDEAGDLNFKGNGSRHFIMTCVFCERPFSAAHELLELRHDIIEKGDLSGYFHASEDRNAVRERVFDAIERHIDDFHVRSVTIDKSLFGAETTPRDMYQIAFNTMFATAGGFLDDGFNLILTDDLPKAAKKGDVKGTLKGIVKRWSGEGSGYRLIHQRSEGDFNLQIADYFCWALYRMEERGDDYWFGKVFTAWDFQYRAVK